MTEWLTPRDEAERLGVTPDVASQYRRRYRPGNTDNVHPVWVDGQHTTIGRIRVTSAAAFLAWNARRTGPHGRPRLRPPGLTKAGHETLAAIHHGLDRQHHPAVLGTLISSNLLQHTTTSGYTLTAAGRRVLDQYPINPETLHPEG